MKIILVETFKLRAVTSLIITIIFFLHPALSQAALSGIGEEGDWIIFKKLEEPVFCGIMGVPSSSTYLRNGQKVNVDRGSHRLSISLIGGTNGIVSFEAGFPIDSQNNVLITIDGRSFNLYTDPNGEIEDYAWPLHTEDLNIINALKAGSQAQITSNSRRGTKVTDIFSLKGVTRGLQRAKESCSNS